MKWFWAYKGSAVHRRKVGEVKEGLMMSGWSDGWGFDVKLISKDL
jgi:hypothetical protein